MKSEVDNVNQLWSEFFYSLKLRGFEADARLVFVDTGEEVYYQQQAAVTQYLAVLGNIQKYILLGNIQKCIFLGNIQKYILLGNIQKYILLSNIQKHILLGNIQKCTYLARQHSEMYLARQHSKIHLARQHTEVNMHQIYRRKSQLKMVHILERSWYQDELSKTEV